MTAAGKLLSASSISTTIDEQPKKETRLLKVNENFAMCWDVNSKRSN